MEIVIVLLILVFVLELGAIVVFGLPSIITKLPMPLADKEYLMVIGDRNHIITGTDRWYYAKISGIPTPLATYYYHGIDGKNVRVFRWSKAHFELKKKHEELLNK